MTEGTWIKFVLVERKKKTDVYEVATKEDDILLGRIRWFGRWRKYSFFPCDDTVFETVCLTEIVQFMNELMQERKHEREHR